MADRVNLLRQHIGRVRLTIGAFKDQEEVEPYLEALAEAQGQYLNLVQKHGVTVTVKHVETAGELASRIETAVANDELDAALHQTEVMLAQLPGDPTIGVPPPVVVKRRPQSYNYP